MDRKEYWNEKYTKYWKEVTDDANTEGIVSHVKKTTAGDFKAAGENVITKFFDMIVYEQEEKLLDYGCGFGRFFSYFNQKSDYYGIDISKAMIDKCKENYPDAESKFLVAEGEKLPFEDGFFEKIICYDVFDACYQEQALAEMFRVVAKNGIIVLTGKNNCYHFDDEQAYIAEEAARKKNHPNYFTDVKSMINQMNNFTKLEHERYYAYRGDFAQDKYLSQMPERFYEWALIVRKLENREWKFEKFSSDYSKTWKERQCL